ncbi:MAG: serine protein kinase RIO [Candidatus Bathyarchaeia archaeon]
MIWIEVNPVRERDFEKEADAAERRYEEEALMREKDVDQFKVLEEVFDYPTLKGVHKLFNRGTIEEIYGVVNAGKEGRIYWGTTPEGEELAIKIYYTTTGDFRRGMLRYIEGDPRFKRISRNPTRIVYVWTQKEFKNLKLVETAGVNAPRALDFYRNILVMTFIGEEGVPAPLLRQLPPEEPDEFYLTTLNEMRLMYQKAEMVHGDLSEYNIMNWMEEPVIFDVSQAMLTQHPIAEELLSRDINNINYFFSRMGVKTLEHEEAEVWIKNGAEELR